MKNCNICNGKGFTQNTNGNLVPCECQYHERWSEYLAQVKNFISLPIKNKVIPSKLNNCNQVINNSIQNIVGIMKLILINWYPEDYVITTLEEINSISFGNHPIYKSIHDFVNNYKYYIVDMTIINTMRAKAPGWNSSDSMCLLDFIKAIIPTAQKVIVVNSGIAEFVKLYPNLWALPGI